MMLLPKESSTWRSPAPLHPLACTAESNVYILVHLSGFMIPHARQADLIFASKTYCGYPLMVRISKTVSQIDVSASWILTHGFIFVDSSTDSATCPPRLQLTKNATE